MMSITKENETAIIMNWLNECILQPETTSLISAQQYKYTKLSSKWFSKNNLPSC